MEIEWLVWNQNKMLSSYSGPKPCAQCYLSCQSLFKKNKKKTQVLRVNFLLGVTVDKSLININLSNKTYRKM